MLTVAQLQRRVERHAPASLAEEWDNVGLVVGRGDAPVRGVLVALELRASLLEEAAAHGCTALVLHHPPIFPSLSSLTDRSPRGRELLGAIERSLAIVVAHTNLDAASGGLNDLMAEDLQLADTAPLVPHPDVPDQGLGRVGRPGAATLGELAARAAAVYGAGGVTVSAPAERPVTRVACCTGSGAGLIDAARAAQADAFVTCDLKYHDADRAEGLALVGLQHAVVERRAMGQWSRRLADDLAGDGVAVRFAATDTDPWERVD